MAGLGGDAVAREVLPSDDADENYLTTIERPCCVMHLEAVPPDIRASWLKGADNYFFRAKYTPRTKGKPITLIPGPSASAPSGSRATGPPATSRAAEGGGGGGSLAKPAASRGNAPGVTVLTASGGGAGPERARECAGDRSQQAETTLGNGGRPEAEDGEAGGAGCRVGGSSQAAPRSRGVGVTGSAGPVTADSVCACSSCLRWHMAQQKKRPRLAHALPAG